jgi:hypothetical protein
MIQMDVCISLNVFLTCSKEYSPSWEANRFSDSQEIPRNLDNPKVNYRINKYRPPVHNLSHIDPIKSLSSNSTPWSSISVLSSHLRMGLPISPFSQAFPLTDAGHKQK